MFLKLIAVTQAADVAADPIGLGTQIACMTNPAGDDGAWPGGADLAPDTLYVRARTGAWPDQHVAA
jgi:hypothetical protein